MRKESIFFFLKKEVVRNTIIDKVCMLPLVHLNNQNYRVKNVFFISKSRMLLRYKWCTVVAERRFPLFLLFARKYLRWYKRPTIHSVDPDLSGPVFVILQLLFRGYNMGLQRYYLFLFSNVKSQVLYFGSFQNLTLLN